MNCRLIISLMILFGSTCLTSCAQNHLESEKNCSNAYNLSELEINTLKIFQNSKEIVVNKLKLREESKTNNIQKFIKGNSFLLINDSNEIVYFDLLDSSLILTYPYLPLNTSELEVEKLFPIQYKDKKLNPTFDTNTESLSLYNCKGDELRIYLYQNKIHSISYFIYEDPEDWGND